jgi:hypothetical protein
MKDKQERIDRSLVDALLYGISKGVAYLGEEKRIILDEMGNMMLGYLLKVGEIKPTDSPENLGRALEELLTRNGFGKKIPLRFKGSPVVPSVPNFINYLTKTKSRGKTSQRRASSSARGPAGNGKVDWVMYEMVLYGMTKGLDSLGAQGQILTNRIAAEMLNYLVDTGKIEPSDDPVIFSKRVTDFFLKARFAAKIDVVYEGSPPNTMVVTYTHSRYHLNVLTRLRNEGNLLYSCPPCVAIGSIYGRSRGTKIIFDAEIRVLPDGKVVLRHRIYPQPDRFSEELVQRTSRMMDKRI